MNLLGIIESCRCLRKSTLCPLRMPLDDSGWQFIRRGSGIILFLRRASTKYLLIILVAAVPGACDSPRPSAEEAIRGWVAAAEDAAERKDRGALMSMVSTSYTDTRGYERTDVDRMLRVLFMRQNKVALSTDIESITVHRETAADILLKVAMIGSNNSAFGFSADAYRFEFELQLEDSEWMLTGARWGALGSDMR